MVVCNPNARGFKQLELEDWSYLQGSTQSLLFSFFAPENNYNIDKHLQVRKQNTTMSPDGRLSKMPGSASMREADLEHHPGQGIGAWNPKTPRDESEMYKNRSEDQKFSVGT